MIRYALRCDQNHSFETWFQGIEAYEKLSAAGQVTCPECGSARVEKALMAPAVPAKKTGGPPAEGPRAFFNQIREYRSKVMAETQDVGRAFPEQARQMHEGDIDHKPIRGNATQEEAKALTEDGIPILPIPPEPPAEN